jgi:thioredoxin reductase
MAILGGGPVGLASLLRARAEGWDATLYERGRVGENVRGWGHVRMFSPLEMNRLEPDSRPARGGESGAAEALLTGAEYVERCLEPLARRPELSGRVRTETEVVAVSRDDLRKADEIATPGRARRPFRLLLEDPSGERVVEADAVLDATGTFATPNWLGQGGIPALGERDLAAAIEHRLPDMTGAGRRAFAGRRTLVIGSGHSAATAIVWLAEVARDDPDTRVAWVTRSTAARPVPEIAGDPLVERARVARVANDLAKSGARWLERLPGELLVELRREGRGLAAALAGVQGVRWRAADRLLALVGYRPDLQLARELQVQTCWATEGTYALSAALLAQEMGGASDCLQAGGFDSSTLVHPEPGFFTLGAKSYGRNSNFLIRSGLQQIGEVLTLLGRRAA